MLLTLLIIPVVVRGYIAYLGMPLDFITSSAANLDLGMGVDAMIYLTMFASVKGTSALGNRGQQRARICGGLLEPTSLWFAWDLEYFCFRTSRPQNGLEFS